MMYGVWCSVFIPVFSLVSLTAIVHPYFVLLLFCNPCNTVHFYMFLLLVALRQWHQLRQFVLHVLPLEPPWFFLYYPYTRRMIVLLIHSYQCLVNKSHTSNQAPPLHHLYLSIPHCWGHSYTVIEEDTRWSAMLCCVVELTDKFGSAHTPYLVKEWDTSM